MISTVKAEVVPPWGALLVLCGSTTCLYEGNIILNEICKSKKKSKAVPLHVMEALGGEEEV
jgi:hypothetical protein